MTASSISPSASGAGSASPPASRSMWCGSMRRRGASSSGRARRCARSRMQLRDVNWLGDGALDAGARRRSAARCSSRSARRGRRSRPGCAVRAAAAVEVELVGGEDGVSPGQACVFYDAPDGQARVLGGGFIQNVADPARSRPLEAAPASAQAAVAGFIGLLGNGNQKYFMTTPHNPASFATMPG